MKRVSRSRSPPSRLSGPPVSFDPGSASSKVDSMLANLNSKQQQLEQQASNRLLMEQQSGRWQVQAVPKARIMGGDRSGSPGRSRQSTTLKLEVDKFEESTTSSSSGDEEKKDGDKTTSFQPSSPSPSTNSSPQTSHLVPTAPSSPATPLNPLQKPPTQPFPVDILFEQHSLKPKTSINLSSYTNHISHETMELILSHSVLMNELVFEETSLTDAQLEIIFLHLQQTNRITSLSLKSISTLSFDFVSSCFTTTICDTLTKLEIVDIPTVTTETLKQISKTFPNLKSLTISKIPAATDEGLIAITKKCKNLEHVDISYLPHITDFSLVKLATSQPHLTYVDISNNHMVTDTGVSDLLKNLRNAKAIILNKLPLISDKSLHLLLEYPVVYGFRHHTNSDKLARFEIEGNDQLTDTSVSYLCNAAYESLTHLAIHSCSNIGSNASFFSTIGQINALSTLSLKDLPFLTEEALISCFEHSKKKLHHLHFSKCPNITDAFLFIISKTCKNLRTISMGFQQHITDEGIAVVLKANKKLTTFHATAMKRLTNKTVTTLARKNLKLTDLDLSHCKQVNTEGLKSINSLRSLTSINLSDNFLLSDNAVRLLPPNKLRKVTLSNVPKLTDTGAFKLAEKFIHLEEIDLSCNEKLTTETAEHVLKFCTNLKSLNLSSIFKVPPTSPSLQDVIDANPHHMFMTVRTDGEDCIFEVEKSTEFHIMTQLEHARYNFRLVHGAKVVQAGWRRLVKYRFETSAMRNRNRYRRATATKIQAHTRRRIATAYVQRVREAKEKVAIILQTRFQFQHLLRLNVRANKHSIKRILKKSFANLLENHALELAEKQKLHERHQHQTAIIHHKRTTQRKVLGTWMVLHAHLKHVKHQNVFADAHRFKIVIPDIVRTWKKKTRQRIQHREALAAVFMFIAHIDNDNSTPQITRRALALEYHRKNLICLAWYGFRKFFEESSETLKKAKIAADHCQANFKKRAINAVFTALIKYAKERIYKRVVKRKGEAWFRKRGKREALKLIRRNAQVQIQFRKDSAKAVKLFEGTVKSGKFRKLKLYRKHRQLMKSRKERGEKHFDYRTTCVYAAWWMDWTIRKIDMKKKMKRARSHFYAKTTRKIFIGWKTYTKHAGDVKAMAKAKQTAMLLGMTFAAWKRFWKDASAAKRMAEAVEKQDEENREIIYKAATDITKVFRGWKDRQEAAQYRAFRDWAILKCQNQYRVWTAKRVLLKRKRWFLLQQNLVEENVEEGMAREEAYMWWWMMMEQHAITIKRILLGHRGRVLAYARRQEKFREKQAEFQTEKKSDMKFYRDQVMLRERMAVMRKDASTMVQKVYRGLLGRRRYEEILQDKKEREIASKVQAAFRGKQGRRKWNARKRHLLNMARVSEARKIQAKGLRSMGFKQRRTQRRAIKVLRGLGLENMTFTQKWGQQLGELKGDARATYLQMYRTVKSWREGGFDSYLRDKTRRRLLIEHEDDVTPKIASAVRIIQKNHHYTGLTGQIVTIDRSFPSKEVAEVRMDVDRRIIYYQLITEATMYDPPQPSMYRIADNFKVGVPYEVSARCKEHILTLAAEERINRDNYLAARTIQQLARGYMSKVRVAKMRYRHWARLRSKRLAVLRTLDIYNATSVQSARTLLAMGLTNRHNVPILYEIPDFPPRIEEAISARTLRRMLNEEFAAKMLRRIAFTEVYEERLREGSYRRRIRSYSSMKVSIASSVTELKKRTTSVIAEKVHARGGGEGFKEKVAMFFGGTEFKRTHDERYAWMKRVSLEQFTQSPHARMNGLCLYHGVFKGIVGSKTHPFQPHGEGMAEFLQGFGVGREEKTLHVTIKQARDLRAADFNNSDPFVVINCNRKKIKTKVILKTLNPIWNETFEIDVTDPYHIIKIIVYDWDKYSSNDFLGQLVFPIADLADGAKVTKWYKLIGNDSGKKTNEKKSKTELDDEKDLGEIELEMQWTEREDSDDIDRKRLQHKRVICIQCWARQVLSREAVKRKKARIEKQIKVLGESSILIQCAYRCVRARKMLKTMRAEKKNMTRIQCATRQWLARKKAWYHRGRYFAARTIQCCLRKYMAALRTEELRRIYGLLKDESAASIQRVSRVGIARAMIKKQRKKVKEKNENYMDTDENLEAMDEWIKSYGYDPIYGTKRLRRICLKVFARVLSVKHSPLVTPYGEAGVEQFPAPFLESREGNDFIIVNLFAHTKLSLPKAERVALRETSPKYWTSLNLSQVSIVGTVELRIIEIQCLFRVALSVRRVAKKRRTRNAAIMVQRRFRWRYKVKEKLALGVQCLWRRYMAMEELKFKKKEVVKAKKIQGAFRCFLGRMALEERRRVSACEILDSSGDLSELFDANRVLDAKTNTFWCSGPEEVSSQWLTFDLGKKHDIGKVKMWVPDNTSCPKEVAIEYANRIIGPWKHAETIKLRQGGERWQSFKVPKTISRYWKIQIKKNFGNASAVSVIGAGFFRAKEVTAFVTEQPKSLMVSPGPPVGRVGGEIVLCSNADGWPLPSFQWTKNGIPIDGETKPTLTIQVGSKKSKTLKRFRCIHCKKINVELPQNLYRVICNNCKTPFDFPEVEEAADLRKPLQLETQEVEMKLKQLKSKQSDMLDDIKSLKNRLKREQFAKERGEELMEDIGDIENEAKQEVIAEQPSLLESIGTRPSGSLREGSMVSGSTSPDKKFNYKKMMKEFTTLEEPLGMSDDDMSSSAGSALQLQHDTGAVAFVAANPEHGAPGGIPLQIGTVVVPNVSNGGNGGNGNSQTAPMSPLPVNNGGQQADTEPPTPQAAHQPNPQDNHDSHHDEDEDSEDGSKAQMQNNDDLSIGHLIGDFMERMGEEEEVKISETEKKIMDLEEKVKEVEAKIETMEKKSWWLLRKRLSAAEHDPCKVTYDGEGVYVCVVSNVRGGEILRSNKSRPAIIFVDDPIPSVIKVHEEYHLKNRLRRRNWPKYLSLYGWFVEGMVCGDVIVRYNEGSVYDGPYVDERWLDYMGNTVKEAFESDHWGVWLTPDDIVYEGPRVDNHFDVTNIQGEYRVTYVNGEVYEGEYVDERRHGIGEYHYLDGSIYEGEFFKNKRQGFGIVTRDDGSLYEGEWDRDFIHGEGIWRWSDGSCFMGDNIDGLRTGRGVYITAHGDVYVGEFKDNLIKGTGTFTYNDGTRYEGTFRDNLREGDAVFYYPDGVKDVGPWRNDRRDGEFVVRRPVFGDDSDTGKGIQWGDEIQHGIWEEGEFVEWCAPPVNPKATVEFIRLFEENDDEFDGVYAMLIARKLPLVPHGIQETHPKVQAILKRIAREGGQLVAYDTYQNTKDKLKEIEPVLMDAKIEYRHIRTNEEHVDTVIAGVSREVDEIDRKIVALRAGEKALQMAIESFWLEDHEDTREKFQGKRKDLTTLERNDWFQIRHYHEPPALIENVMSAVCTILMEKDTWKGAQGVLGSSQQNKDDGDKEAVWQEYEVKILHLLEAFDVFARVDDPALLVYIGHFLVDPRFKSDNYFLQSYGPAAVKLVEWIWSAYAYIKKAKQIKKKSDEEKSLHAAIGRFQQQKDGLLEKIESYETRAKGLREKVSKSGRRKDRWQAKYDKLEALLMKCQEMVVQYTSDDEHELDDYEKMIEAEGEIKGTVETVVELMTQEVEGENDDPDIEELGMSEDGRTLDKMLNNVVRIGREKMFRLGDYKYTGGRLIVAEGGNVIDVKETQEKLAQDVVEQLNFLLNEYPSTKQWTMPDGSRIKENVIEDVIRSRWSTKDHKDALDAADRKWDLEFSRTNNTAFMSVQARTNFIMSDNAKEEARIWRERHREEVDWIENWMAGEFEQDYHEDTAKVALDMKEDRKIGVDLMAMADVWCRRNRNLVLEELDRQNADLARKYQEKHPDETAKSILMFRNLTGEEGVAEDDNAEAQAWISLNLGAVIDAEDEEGARLSNEFETKCEELIRSAEAEAEREAEKGPPEEGAEKDKKETNKQKKREDQKKEDVVEGKDGEGEKKKKKSRLDRLDIISREAVRLKKDIFALKEERELALAWGAREENKEKFHLMQNQVSKEDLHNDLVSGSNISGLKEKIETLYSSVELRRTRLGLKTDKQREEEEEEAERKKKKREAQEEKERERERLEKEREPEEEKKAEAKKKPGAGLLPKAKKKKSPKKAKKAKKVEVEEVKEPEVTDEGVLKLQSDIVKARKKIVEQANKRIEYNEKRLKMFQDRDEELKRDKTYLEVAEAIRPSEAKVELHKQKTLRDDRLKFLVGAIAEEKMLLKGLKETVEQQRKRIFWETKGEEGGEKGGDEDWEQYYDEQYQAWAWYNKKTQEVQWS